MQTPRISNPTRGFADTTEQQVTKIWELPFQRYVFGCEGLPTFFSSLAVNCESIISLTGKSNQRSCFCH